MRNKRGNIVSDYPVYFGIAVFVFLILGLSYLILKGNLSGSLQSLKNLFRFGK